MYSHVLYLYDDVATNQATNNRQGREVKNPVNNDQPRTIIGNDYIGVTGRRIINGRSVVSYNL